MEGVERKCTKKLCEFEVDVSSTIRIGGGALYMQ